LGKKTLVARIVLGEIAGKKFDPVKSCHPVKKCHPVRSVGALLISRRQRMIARCPTA